MIKWIQTTGSIVAILLLVQFLTGVLLAFYYVPSVDHAHTTVSYIEKVVSSGSWIRSLHHYGSQWLTLFAFLHIVQLFLTKTYVASKTEWIVSILIFGLVLAAGGTGYSLPWDARAFFSTRVAEGLMAGLPFVGRNARLWLLGSNEISTLTLSRFFAIHVLVIPACLALVLFFRMFGSIIVPFFNHRSAIVVGLVFLALALWSLKNPAPLGPSVSEMSAEYLPRPGAQFLWLYQTLKYIPGGVGSLAGIVLPGMVLLLLALLPWLKSQQWIGGLILGAGVVVISLMTVVSYMSDRRDPKTRAQLAKQAAQEQAVRREPFKPALITLASASAANAGGTPVMYSKFCAQCHGASGEGGRQGPFRFPPLIDVSGKPRRTADDIVAILKDPTAYGLQPPMTSFAGKLTEEQMMAIAEWVVKLKR